MRITSGMQFRSFLAALERINVRAARTTRQSVSGLRVERPSDDPLATARLTSLASRIARLDQLDRSARSGDTTARLVEGALEAIGNLTVRARQLAVQGGSDAGSIDRSSIAQEIDSIFEQVLTSAAVQEDGRYLMSGTLTDRTPFDTGGVYQGNLTALTAEIGDGQVIVVAPTAAGALQSGVDLPGTLKQLAVALRTDDKTGIQTAIADLGTALDQVSQARSRVGTAISAVQTGLLRRADERLALQTEVSDLGDANLAETVVQIAQIGQAREAALATAARIGQRNLFDFLA
ncbi:MAG: hypothetical protein ACE5IK_04555 [Acidobacteriota bacterium]